MLRVVFLSFCSIIAIADSQDIVGCGGFIISEVEINFSVIEVCTCWHSDTVRLLVKCGCLVLGFSCCLRMYELRFIMN